MLDSKFVEDISRKVSDLIAQSPVADVEKNMRALLQSTFAKLDLVTREEFDVQTQVLQNARAQLTALEQKITELETRLTGRE
jgi:BMFP domain-containing protein YqiC